MQNKQEQIIQMFDAIAPSYDKANRILSFGIDVSWRQKACKRVLSCFSEQGFNIDKKGLNIADIACGTGDMIQNWLDIAKKEQKKIHAITGIDPSEKMLELAQKKIKNANFIKAGASKLPFENEQIDILSISYGIRNVMDRKEAWSEFARVLKKNGVLLILEFTRTEKKGFVGELRNFYLNYILPKVGGYISKNKAAYEYLPSSIDSFLSKDEIIKELEETGFDLMYYDSFSFDISSSFIVKKR